jgi:cell division FtsZ-interacting protein ZapD
METNKIEFIPPNNLVMNELSTEIYGDSVNYNHILDNINDMGIIQPILVNASDMKVISGNLRLKAALELDLKKVPVIFTSLNELETKTVFLSSNISREKTMSEKFNELLFVKKIFNKVKQGSRTELSDELMEEKIHRDRILETLTKHTTDKLNRMTKVSRIMFGDEGEKFVMKKLVDGELEGKTLNSLTNEFEELYQTMLVGQNTTKTISDEQAIKKIKKVLNQLPQGVCQQILQVILDEYTQVG